MGVYDSDRNLIKGNRLAHNFALGILLEKSDHNRVRGNRSVRDGTGVTVLHGDRNVIARNHIVHPRGGGGDGEAIQVPPRSDHNVIARNSIRDTLKNGIHAGAMGNVVRRNHITGAGRNGVRVVGGAKHLVLRRNHVRHAKDDGLDVNSRSTRLTRNRAVGNGDLGIEAVRGVIDGGGNRASGNGDARQCLHVKCH
jgi:parallel beta-helix repeat protein